jgi:predicted transcriptional regulator
MISPYLDQKTIPPQAARLLLELAIKSPLTSRESYRAAGVCTAAWTDLREYLVDRGLIKVVNRRRFGLTRTGRDRAISFLETQITDKGRLVAKELAYLAELIR